MNNETVHLRNIQWNEFLSFTDSVKYIAISKGLQNADRDSADVYSFTGTGPFQLLPGETKQYAFLIGASRKLINLVEEVQEQRARYACLNGNSTLRLNHLFIGRSGCANCSRGYILPHFTGGTAPYQYFLNGNAVEMSDLSGLRAGNYNLRIVDAVDCSLEQNLTIKE